MSKNRILIAVALIVVVICLFLLNTPPFSGRKADDINVILLTVDSFRPDHLGCYGYNRPTSPNIDTMARGGVVFRQAYAQSAWTMPCLMSIFTSLQPPVHHLEKRGNMVDTSITTIFDCFAENGYTVPNICFLLSIPEFATIRVGPVEEEYFSGEDGEEMFRWLEENHESKFFVWYHYRDVHLPYKPKVEFRATFAPYLENENRLSPGIRAVLSDAASVPVGTVEFEKADKPTVIDLYDGEVRQFDRFLGRLLVRLREFGLLEKTLLVITADHGEELMDHGFVGHASTTHSATLYDEIIRIPLIMSLPGYLPKGRIVSEKVQQIDVMPTILDIAGIQIPAGIQGHTLIPSIFEEHRQRTLGMPVFAETVFGGYQATQKMEKTRLRSVRSDAWKLIEIETDGEKTYELFDLLIDMKELRDVHAEEPETVATLQTFLAEWRNENNAIRKSIDAASVEIMVPGMETACPEFFFPYNNAVLRFAEREGVIRAAWTGSPTSAYVIEYDIGSGVYHLTGSFLTFGSQRNFGPYSHEMWNALAVRNPWRVRISPDVQPRCWSDWIEFTFE